VAKVYLMDKERGLYVFECPGCGYNHSYGTKPYTDTHGRQHPVWSFNGDVDQPTFNPSLLVNAGMPEKRCHLFLKDGMIQFLSDCYHELAGQTVECPEWED